MWNVGNRKLRKVMSFGDRVKLPNYSLKRVFRHRISGTLNNNYGKNSGIFFFTGLKMTQNELSGDTDNEIKSLFDDATVFITGVTGFLGHVLLHKLLK